MTPAVPVPPTAQTTVQGLWVCFWLTVLGMLLWTAIGPLPVTGVRLPLLFAVVAAVPVWFLTGRLTAWVRQVSRRASEPQDVRPVAWWRIALLVLYVLSAVGTATDTASPPSYRVGVAAACLAMAVCVWRFRAVLLAVQATGTPEASPTARSLAPLLPGWTWTVRAGQVGQLVYLLCADPTFSAGGVLSSLLLSASAAGTLELLLRFVCSRIGAQAT